MKIGGGGLQALVTQQVAPVEKDETSQKRPKEEATILDPGINKPIPKEDELIKAVEEMNKTMDLLNRDLKFQVHDKTDRIMVKVLNKDTKKVIKEIPPQEVLDMAAKLKETIGLLVDKYV